MLDSKKITKWGFGNAPISEATMRKRYDAAVQTVLDLMYQNITPSEVYLDDVSELKGMFSRCAKQDQWDWFSVYCELGEPPREKLSDIVSHLKMLRRTIASSDLIGLNKVLVKLEEHNIVHYLNNYQCEFSDFAQEPSAGWVYILSTREQPNILKIGMTCRSVSTRVKEINSATGILFPYAARARFRVKEAARTEKEIHSLLSRNRVRDDREFFDIPYSEAEKIIAEHICQNSLQYQSKGVLKWFDAAKKYGFISMDGSEEEVFFHTSEFISPHPNDLEPGSKLEFSLGKNMKGLFAKNVSLVSS
jgi:cold shock CspA family protein